MAEQRCCPVVLHPSDHEDFGDYRRWHSQEYAQEAEELSADEQRH